MSKKDIIFLLAAVLLGTLITFTGVVTTLLLLVLIAILSFVSIGFLISSVFLGRKALKVSLITIMPLLVAYGTSATIRYYKHSKAVQITKQLEKYRIKHGYYPKELPQATTILLKGLEYEPDSNLLNFHMEYLMDGFNREYFDSVDKEWGTLGWHD